MSNTEAVSVLSRMIACRCDDDCKLTCEHCPSNYSPEEMMEALHIGRKCIQEKVDRERMIENL